MSDELPGMMERDREGMTVPVFMMLMLVGVLIWIGLMHIARDAYAWTTGRSVLERCE